jgi:hypothetical protein
VALHPLGCGNFPGEPAAEVGVGSEVLAHDFDGDRAAAAAERQVNGAHSPGTEPGAQDIAGDLSGIAREKR